MEETLQLSLFIYIYIYNIWDIFTHEKPLLSFSWQHEVEAVTVYRWCYNHKSKAMQMYIYVMWEVMHSSTRSHYNYFSAWIVDHDGGSSIMDHNYRSWWQLLDYDYNQIPKIYNNTHILIILLLLSLSSLLLHHCLDQYFKHGYIRPLCCFSWRV